MLKILKFSATWCQPCQRMAPIFDDVAAKTPDVDFEKVDIDEQATEAAEYKISAVPTIVFVKDGVEVDRVVGLVKGDELLKKIANLK